MLFVRDKQKSFSRLIESFYCGFPQRMIPLCVLRLRKLYPTTEPSIAQLVTLMNWTFSHMKTTWQFPR